MEPAAASLGSPADGIGARPFGADANPFGAAAEASEPAPPAPVTTASRRASASETPNWWYSDAGEQVGPVTAGRLAALLNHGELTLSTWVFEGGSSDWQELAQVQTRLPAVSTIW